MPYQKRDKQHYRNFAGINTKSSPYITGDNQMLDIRNMDFNEVGSLTKRPGSTQAVSDGTSGPITSLFEFVNLNGASFLFAGSPKGLFQLYSNGYTNLVSGISVPTFDYQAFINGAWIANGQTFLKFNGTLINSFGLLNVTDLGAFGGGVSIVSFQGTGLSSLGQSTGAFLFTRYRIGFVNNYGFFGPLVTRAQQPYLPEQVSVGNSATGGASAIYFSFTLDVYNPTAFTLLGISYISIFRSDDPPQFTSFAPTQLISADTNFFLLATLPIGATAYLDVTPELSASVPPNFFRGFYATYTPRFIEVNQNRMFFAGFSNAASTVWFSDIINPELSDADSNFEVRTNNSDFITGIKDFQDQLIIFKQKSFHKLLGDSEDNFQVVNISTDYGCLNNNSTVEYRDILLFLDEKGVVQYNGASWQMISDPVEDVFRTMNVTAALDTARAVHYDLRNQVWFAIPTGQSQVNNTIVVFDYLLNAWTIFDGILPASLSMVKQQLSSKTLWFGDQSGKVNYFSPSFMGDNGQGITALAFTKFDAPDGQNVQNMFRRLFLDVNKISGATGVINVEAYSDYDQSTIQATFSIYQNLFQSRYDFGVSAKGIAFKMSHFSSTLPITYFGYLTQRRYLREV